MASLTISTRLSHAYIDCIGRLVEQKTVPTFLREACALRQELCDPCTCIHEHLAWIEFKPASPFEHYLRQLVHVHFQEPSCNSKSLP